MVLNLSSGTNKVQEFFQKNGFSFKVKELPTSARTAQEAADSIGCDIAQIAKSLIFEDIDSGEPILIITSGTNRVSIKKIEAIAGLKIKKANAKFVKENTGFTIGGVPPAGHIKHLKTYIDRDLQKYDVIWAAAGTPFAIFQLKPQDLQKLTDGKQVDLAEEK